LAGALHRMRTLGLVLFILVLCQSGCYSASEYRGPGGLSRYPVTHSWAKYLLVLPPLPAGDAETVFTMSGLPTEDFLARIESQQSLARLGVDR
jgi:hypothetical protein